MWEKNKEILKKEVIEIIKKDTEWLSNKEIEENYKFIINNLLREKYIEKWKNFIAEWLFSLFNNSKLVSEIYDEINQEVEIEKWKKIKKWYH